MRFSYKPSDLHVYGERSGKTFGTCSGFLPPSVNCQNGFATDDVFFLEVCLFSFLCKNNEELFTLEVGAFYVCDFSADAFDELQSLIVQPPI